jgi:hypothetical protein
MILSLTLAVVSFTLLYWNQIYATENTESIEQYLGSSSHAVVPAAPVY